MSAAAAAATGNCLLLGAFGSPCESSKASRGSPPYREMSTASNGWGPQADPLISVEELLSELSRQEQLLILDCSMTELPVFGNRCAEEEYLRGPRIPGAQFFCIDTCSDRSNPYPHMLPSRAQLRAYVIALHQQQKQQQQTVQQLQQLHDQQEKREQQAEERQVPVQQQQLPKIVLYDSVGFFSASRVYWMLRWGGLTSRVLDGGIKAWVARSLPVDTRPFSRECLLPLPETAAVADSAAGEDTAAAAAASQWEEAGSGEDQNSLVVSYVDLLKLLDEAAGTTKEASTSGKRDSSSSIGKDSFLLVDVRTHDRFSARCGEPREGVFGGHIPTSINLPFTTLLQPHAFFPSSSCISSGPMTYLCPFGTSVRAPPFGYATLKTGTSLLFPLGPLLTGANVKGVSKQLEAFQQQRQLQHQLQQEQQDQQEVPQHKRPEYPHLDFSEAKRIVCTCGSGVSSCILFCALLEVGYPVSLLSVYDGSWTEWAERRLAEAPLGGPPGSQYPTLVVPPPTQQQQEALLAVISSRGLSTKSS
ncbi:3-mercaptopyruvate sulfurtransferase, putative [Eimeria tenella]|uniref:3-mercaptopyruvate sulfurtransferase, putative n=1 Tax=Eimeria tenella TaxID=5802 RepID=U6KQL5_EIMTE|nr:3-mercaptopyruvate sulfurtransferase, putative [Eimeria tenella]CDJ37728.1 3-mercaptopyruvate sulfurtransferase, putative [Eimeria tenella]|eukprot:XP_013228566.1 3-mercaptopyruvate sulfurtransferase, putative [Eimeria tenella]